MKTQDYHPSVAQVREAGSYEAALEVIRRQEPRVIDIYGGGNSTSFRYVTRAGKVKIAYGTGTEIARLLRRHGYSVRTI